MKNKKKIISALAIVLIVVLIVTATYAYFQAQTGEGSSTDINITTATVDNLTFETGDAISINATQTNFASGLDSLSDDTYVKATLIANNDTNSASANYYVYLNISTNEFVYTTSDSTAELILSITMDGTEVTSLDGYDYVSVTDGNSNVISGFDITTASGLITIADNYLIESTGIEVDDWEITVTFVNLDSDQSGNAGKSFSASLIIQGDEFKYTLSEYIMYEVYSSDGENDLYYFDGEGDYVNSDLEAVDYSYRYSGSDSFAYCYVDENIVLSFELYAEELYLFPSDLDESYCSSTYKVTDLLSGDVYYFDETILDYIDIENPVAVKYDDENEYCTTTSGDEVTGLSLLDIYDITSDDCVGNAYYRDGSYVLISIEKASGTYTVKDNDVNNYICFGSDGDTCPDDSLYRIIGLFQNDDGDYEAKIIKADYADSTMLGTDGDYAYTFSVDSEPYYRGKLSSLDLYTWSYARYKEDLENYSTEYIKNWTYNEIEVSSLSAVNLGNYLNKLESKWSNMISNHTWIVGGNTYENIASHDDHIVTAYDMYMNEIVNYESTGSITLRNSSGLIYVSDYGYAIDSEFWNIGTNYNNLEFLYNWVDLGYTEWTITRDSSDNVSVFQVGMGVSSFSAIDPNSSSPIRPVFYLESSTAITGGSGTFSDPYILSMN